MKWNERNKWKFTHRRVTANVCVPTVCSTHTCKLQKLSMGIAMKFVVNLMTASWAGSQV